MGEDSSARVAARAQTCAGLARHRQSGRGRRGGRQLIALIFCLPSLSAERLVLRERFDENVERFESASARQHALAEQLRCEGQRGWTSSVLLVEQAFPPPLSLSLSLHILIGIRSNTLPALLRLLLC